MKWIFVILLHYVIALVGGHYFTRMVLNLIPVESKSRGIERAGTIIGYLERALIISFIVLNEYSLIGFIVAAKSIARFEELKERSFAEYFIVGTLASTLFAVLVGLFLAYYLGEL